MMSPVDFVACIIAGDEAEREAWERLVASLRGNVDAIALSWNGARDTPPDWVLESDVPVGWSCLKWADDFSAQRNLSFRMGEGMGAEWLLWIDTDDELVAPFGLASVVNDVDNYSDAVMLRYDYATDEAGRVTVKQQRERLIRANRGWSWSYPIHEICGGQFGSQIAKRDGAWVKHHHDGTERERRDRNRRIISRYRQQHPEVALFDYYFAREVHIDAIGATDGEQRFELLQAAVLAYTKFVEREPNTDRTYFAFHEAANIYRDLGDFQRSVDTDLQCLKIRPGWPEAYNGIAQTYLRLGEWSRAEQWATLALTNNERDTTQVTESHEELYAPHAVRGVARQNLGDYRGAMEDMEAARREWDAPGLEERTAQIREKLVEVPVDFKQLRRSLRGTRPDKSIAFFTSPLFEPWHPKLEAEGGIGGAETCVMRLAKRFAHDGWRVAVFGTPGLHAGVDEDGIEWWRSDEFLAAEPWTVVVSSRQAELFDSPLNARYKVLWLHDVNLRGTLADKPELEGRRAAIDKVVTLSAWHATHTANLYGELPIAVIPNGIEAQLYEDVDVSTPRRDRFVWSSSPDRGLDALVEMWPEVVRRLPRATLHIFYGWESIDRIVSTAPGSPMAKPLVYFKENVTSLIAEVGGEEAGIFWHGRVPQHELARQLRTMSAWAYPTDFCETFCITAIETAAAGVVPVTSDLAALRERVPARFRVPGNAGNSTFRTTWMELLTEVMNYDDARMAEERATLRQEALRYTWDRAYEGWLALLDPVLQRQLV